jgi:hypothetical protein
VQNLSRTSLAVMFGVEMNFAMLSADEDRAWYTDAQGKRCGVLDAPLAMANLTAFGIHDEVKKCAFRLSFDKPAEIWAIPVQTVSQSEGGFELVYQSSAVVPRWGVRIGADAEFKVGMVLDVELL